MCKLNLNNNNSWKKDEKIREFVTLQNGEEKNYRTSSVESDMCFFLQILTLVWHQKNIIPSAK